jgi:hypothetical protein
VAGEAYSKNRLNGFCFAAALNHPPEGPVEKQKPFKRFLE